MQNKTKTEAKRQSKKSKLSKTDLKKNNFLTQIKKNKNLINVVCAEKYSLQTIHFNFFKLFFLILLFLLLTLLFQTKAKYAKIIKL